MYSSNKQRRFFHSLGAKRQGISTPTIKEFDKESKGMQLPETAEPYKMPKYPKIKAKLKRV